MSLFGHQRRAPSTRFSSSSQPVGGRARTRRRRCPGSRRSVTSSPGSRSSSPRRAPSGTGRPPRAARRRPAELDRRRGRPVATRARARRRARVSRSSRLSKRQVRGGRRIRRARGARPRGTRCSRGIVSVISSPVTARRFKRGHGLGGLAEDSETIVPLRRQRRPRRAPPPGRARRRRPARRAGAGTRSSVGVDLGGDRGRAVAQLRLDRCGRDVAAVRAPRLGDGRAPRAGRRRRCSSPGRRAARTAAAPAATPRPRRWPGVKRQKPSWRAELAAVLVDDRALGGVEPVPLEEVAVVAAGEEARLLALGAAGGGEPRARRLGRASRPSSARRAGTRSARAARVEPARACTTGPSPGRPRARAADAGRGARRCARSARSPAARRPRASAKSSSSREAEAAVAADARVRRLAGA